MIIDIHGHYTTAPKSLEIWRNRQIAGIGNPARFFAHLTALGLSFEARAFPDHHSYTPADLVHAGADAIVMTEKDAVKCAAFAHENHWALRVDAMRRVAEQLLAKRERVRTLTNSPNRSNSFGEAIEVHPLAFDDPVRLEASLDGPHPAQSPSCSSRCPSFSFLARRYSTLCGVG